MLLLDLLLTLYFWTIAIIGLIVTFFTCIILYPFIDQKTFSRLYESITGYTIIYAMTIPGFWDLKITDLRKDKSWAGKRYIIVANHRSFIDSLVTVVFPLKKKFMVGRIFTQIPVFGWLAKTSGHVPVDKNDASTTFDAVDRAVKTMEDGCSFMIYPEGQRSRSGKMMKFKTGAYRMSQITGIPILPVCLKGTNKGMRFGAIVSTANIELIIGEPFNVPDGWSSIHRYIDHTKSFIKEYSKDRTYMGSHITFIDD